MAISILFYWNIGRLLISQTPLKFKQWHYKVQSDLYKSWITHPVASLSDLAEQESETEVPRKPSVSTGPEVMPVWMLIIKFSSENWITSPCDHSFDSDNDKWKFSESLQIMLLCSKSLKDWTLKWFSVSCLCVWLCVCVYDRVSVCLWHIGTYLQRPSQQPGTQAVQTR